MLYSSLLANTNCQAIIIRGTDIHGLETPHPSFMLRHALSGFYGSAGTVVIHKNGTTCLWTDSRYELAAQAVCNARGSELVIDSEHAWEKQIRWVAKQSKSLKSPYTSSIALCELQFSQSEYSDLALYAQQFGYTLKNLAYPILRKRALQILKQQKDARGIAALLQTDIIENNHAVWHISEKHVPYNARKKLHALEDFIAQKKAHCFITANIHEIAYLTGLRAKVLPNLMLCPCVLSLIRGNSSQSARYVFMLPQKLCTNFFVKKFHAHLEIPLHAIHTLVYEDLLKDTIDFSHFTNMLTEYRQARVLYDPAKFPRALVHALEQDETMRAEGRRLETTESPLRGVKDLRSDKEIELIKESIAVDCAALLEALCEVVEKLARGEVLYEKNIAEIVLQYRKAQAGFLQESFQTISAAGANGALPHYAVEQGVGSPIKIEEPYLLDCGAHYACEKYAGTTDITRSFLFSTLMPFAQENKGIEEAKIQMYKEDYTAVLKAHIALVLSVFASSTHGGALHQNVLSVLKQQNNRSFGHSTGHGIGFCTDVHEGAESIGSRAVRKGSLQPNMIFSNEPGYYVQDVWGIRLENIVCVRNSERPDFLRFETMTFFPFQQNLVIENNLTLEEVTWLRNYQAQCKDMLMSRVSSDAVTFLEHLTA